MGSHVRQQNTHTHDPLYQHMDKLGRDNFYIEFIETYHCNIEEGLAAKEGEWIRRIGTLNKRVAGRTKKQWGNHNHDRRMQ